MLKEIIGPMRLPFLILTPACVLLGVGTAVWSSGNISILYVVLTLIGALTAHISVNAFNEYFDFRSGLDFKTQRTPFSGGSGTLPANPLLAKQALLMAIIAFGVTAAIGLFFVKRWGPGLFLTGIPGLFLLYAYTPWIAHHALWCLIAPGLGFGPFMVMGTHFVLTGTYHRTAFIASLVPFFLVSNLLLLNQFPDVEADRSVGRRHLPILIGRRGSSLVYGGFLLAAYLTILLGVLLNLLPNLSLLGLMTLALALPAALGAYRHADNIPRLIPIMILNVIINIVTPMLMAIGLFFA
ncbi:MAG: prenyltransferase [Desulfobacterales bacterium CG07_land_8_20_14_0_80_52_14]|nr:MAG: prenyltransferase [Desulfobacterales bacterium CG23_combo_of_CG06-09_8_20_14_all_52_9]PIU50690.1 MAG: prenyltransferase [Desulfobacterales bacterium CG07_land_8_20_14_0_80_52_14]